MTTPKFNTWTGEPLMGDSFSNFLAGLGITGRDKVLSHVPVMRNLAANELSDLYRGDWLSRKIVDIPAFDTTRAWRRWNASKDQTRQLETIERQFGLQRKCMEAFVRARLFGGAAIIMGVKGAGEWNEPLDLDKVGKGALKFIHVVTGGKLPMLTAGPLVRDITSPWYGEPSYYERSNTPVLPAPGGVPLAPTINLGKANSFDIFIHPSRVVRLTGLDYPDMESAPDPWGDSVLQPVWDAIRDAGLVGSSIANLTSRANVNVIQVPGLTQKLATEGGTAEVTKRFANANVAASVVNALLLDTDEKWNQLSVNFSQLPQIVQMFLLIGAAAADIPSTRLLSREPSGMNATGDSDTRNYYDRLSSDQKVRLTPLLSRLDEVLIRSALGNRPAEINYDWNPLWQLDEGQKADINLKNAQAFQIDNNAGLIDPLALKKGRENQLIANDVYPGLDQAIQDAEGSEDDGDAVDEQALARLGLDPDTHAPLPPPGLEGPPGGPQRALPPPGPNNRPANQTQDQSALSFLVPGGPRRRRKGKKVPVRYPDADGGASTVIPFVQPKKSLYVHRPLLASESFHDWAKGAGFTSTVSDPHVTLLYSRKPMDWSAAPPDQDAIMVHNGAPRSIERLGDQGAVALCFDSDELSDRHDDLVDAGGSHDYDGYRPHITITYQAPDDLDLNAIEPYSGPLIFGPEEYREIKAGGLPSETSDADFDESKHPRDPGGKFAPNGGGASPAAKTPAAKTSSVATSTTTTPRNQQAVKTWAAMMSPEQLHAELSRRLEANAQRNAQRAQSQRELNEAMAAEKTAPDKAGWVYRAKQFMGDPRSKDAVERAAWEFSTKQVVGIAHKSAIKHLIEPVVEGVAIAALAHLGAPIVASAVAVEVARYALDKLIEHSPLSADHAHELLMKVCDTLIDGWHADSSPFLKSIGKPIGAGGWFASDDDSYADMLLAVLRLKAGLEAIADEDSDAPDPGEAISDTWTEAAWQAAAAARAGGAGKANQAHALAQHFTQARFSAHGKASRQYGIAAQSYATAATAYREAAAAERDGRHGDAQALTEAADRNLAAAHAYVKKHGLADAEVAGSRWRDYIGADAADPDEPRDENGRWTAGGGGSQAAGQPDARRARHGGGAGAESPGSYQSRSPGAAETERHVKAVWQSGGSTFDELSPAGAGLFHDTLAKTQAAHQFGAAVTLHSVQDYGHQQLFMRPDKSGTFSLDGNNIVSVVKDPSSAERGFAAKALALAVQRGGARLDCFDTELPTIYSRAGFRAVARLPFNDEYKPEGWDYQRFAKYNSGRPDVVFMVYDPAHAGKYTPTDGARVSTYEEGEAAQQRALAALAGGHSVSDDFDPAKHPRVESGPGGGQFTSGGGGTQAAAAPAKPKLSKTALKGELKKFVNPDVSDQALDDLAQNLVDKDVSAEDFEKGMFAGLNENRPTLSRPIGGAISISSRIPGGSMSRSIDFTNKTASHNYLSMTASRTGGGTAKKLLASQIALYQKLGLHTVEVHANIDIGGYAWAKYGFVPTQRSWDDLRYDLQQRFAGSEGGSGASSWDELSASAQNEAEAEYIRQNRDEELSYQIDNWRTEDARDDARDELVSNYLAWKSDKAQSDPKDADLDWMTDAIEAVRKDREDNGQHAIPYTDVQLMNAMTLSFAPGYGGRKNDLDFDDKLLQDPNNLPPPEQQTLPGIEPADRAAQLTQDMRDQLTKAVLDSFEEKAEDKADNLDPPSYLEDAASENLADVWTSMDDRERFRWVQRNTDLANEHEETQPELDIADPTARDAIRKALESDNPKAIWAIADSKYGKDLLLRTDWQGELDLTDPDTMTRFHDYVSKAPAKAAA